MSGISAEFRNGIVFVMMWVIQCRKYNGKVFQRSNYPYWVSVTSNVRIKSMTQAFYQGEKPGHKFC